MHRYVNRIQVAIYLLVASVLWPFLFYYVNNPDAFQYLSLSRHWVEGDWSSALNGYWGPGLPLLMAPALWAGFEPLAVFKVTQVLLGAAALILWQSVVSASLANTTYRKLLTWAAIPFLLSYAFLTLTADLMFLVVSLYLFRMLVKGETSVGRIALTGAALYFTKAFGLPFFLAVMGCRYWFRRHEKAEWKSTVSILGILLLLVAPWIFLISQHYGRFTINESARFNFSREVMPRPGEIIRLPVLTDGPLRPLDSNASSAWEEPLRQVAVTPLKPFQHSADRQQWMDAVVRNLQSEWYFDFRNQFGLFVLVLVFLAVYFNRSNLTLRNPAVFFSACFLMLMDGGDALILFHTRYTWLATFLLLFASGLALDSLPEKFQRFRLVLGLLLVIWAVKRPVKEILFSDDAPRSMVQLAEAFRHPINTLTKTYSDDRIVYHSAREIHERNRIDGPVVSRLSNSDFRHRYSSSLMITSINGVPYFGSCDDRNPMERHKAIALGAQYLLVWDDSTITDVQPTYSASNMHLYRLTADSTRY